MSVYSCVHPQDEELFMKDVEELFRKYSFGMAAMSKGMEKKGRFLQFWTTVSYGVYYRFNKKKRAEQAERLSSNPDLFTTLQIFDFMERPVMRELNKRALPKVHLNHKIYVPKLDSHGLAAPGKPQQPRVNTDAVCVFFVFRCGA